MEPSSSAATISVSNAPTTSSDKWPLLKVRVPVTHAVVEPVLSYIPPELARQMDLPYFARNVCRYSKLLKMKKSTEIIVVKNKYGRGVLMKNWDVKTREHEWNIFRYCRNRTLRGLKVEKTSLRITYLLKELRLEKSLPFITNNMQVQITAAYIPVPSRTRMGVFLSSTISDLDEEVLSEMKRSPQLSWSTDVLPYVKNVFCIIRRTSGSSIDDQLLYGDEFYMSTVPDENNKVLYVGAKHRVVGFRENNSNHYPIQFFPTPSSACIWRGIAAKPEERDRKHEQPIYFGDDIQMVNVLLGQKLSVESKFTFNTMFGQEYEATAHNHKLLRTNECVENCITFAINVHPPQQKRALSIVYSEGRAPDSVKGKRSA